MTRRRTRRELLQDGLTAAAGAALLPGLGCPTDEDPCEDWVDDSGSEPLDGVLNNADLDRTVIRILDTRVTDYDYADPVNEPSHQHIDAEVLAGMLAAGVRELTGAPDAPSAWAGLLGAYSCDDKVAIKVNFNARSNADEGRLNNSATMVLTVVDALVGIGLCPGNITIFDASRGEIANVVDPVLARYPEARCLFGSDVETSGDESLVFPSLLDVETDQPLELPVPVPVVEAQHLINLHLLKGHHGGVTGALKNWFGLAHDVWNSVHGSRDEWPRWDDGVQCAELAAHSVLRDKTRLLISEALFGTHKGADRVPDPYVEERLWGSSSPSSLVLGTNPVCHDSVLLSLIRCERAAAGESNDQSDHWLVSASEPPYSLGNREAGELAERPDGRWDLEFEEVLYRTVWMEEDA